MPSFKYNPSRKPTFNGVSQTPSEENKVEKIEDVKIEQVEEKKVIEETKPVVEERKPIQQPVSQTPRPMPRPINSVPKSNSSGFSFMSGTTQQKETPILIKKEEETKPVELVTKEEPIIPEKKTTNEDDIKIVLNKTVQEEPVELETPIDEITEEIDFSEEEIKLVEENEDDFFGLEDLKPVKKEKPIKQPREKKKKEKTKKPIKLNKKTVVKIGTILGISLIIFLIVFIVSNIIQSTNVNYSITNDDLRARVVQHVEPGDLIDVKNSLPLQITSKDLIITDTMGGEEIEVILWDYTNTNLNKLNIAIDGKVIKENVTLKRKPLKIKIPRECRLEINISEEVSSPNTTYAMKVNENVYFNKLSTTRGSIIHFSQSSSESNVPTNPAQEQVLETAPPVLESEITTEECETCNTDNAEPVVVSE